MELKVRLTGDGAEKTTTSAKGRYEFRDLPPAQYRIELLVPDGYSTDSAERTVEIPNPRACAEEPFALSVNGRISGQLLRPDGGGAEGCTSSPSTDVTRLPVPVGMGPVRARISVDR
jgi:hypothetical protein